MRITLILITVFLSAAVLSVLSMASADAPDAPPGMVWIPGGEFVMGSDDPEAWRHEQPPHRVRVDGFWMDATPVTNAEFRAFVEATGYVTTAEKPIDIDELMKQLPPGTPPPPPEMLQPGSVVFTPPSSEVPLNDWSRWWRFVPGANWRHPQGPDGTIDGKDDHPVVHVSWFDAKAYANWAGKRLPTEAEWEYAARGGLVSEPYVWGAEAPSEAHCPANTWQGTFPHRNTADDGYLGTSPVKAFDPNGYGLYDMAGNVWEWTADYYRPDTFARRAKGGVIENPQGPTTSYDPREPFAVKRVQKGGSYLCNASYCSGYRPSARQGNTPDTGTSHAGFRCVVTKAMRSERETEN